MANAAANIGIAQAGRWAQNAGVGLFGGEGVTGPPPGASRPDALGMAFACARATLVRVSW